MCVCVCTFAIDILIDSLMQQCRGKKKKKTNEKKNKAADGTTSSATKNGAELQRPNIPLTSAAQAARQYERRQVHEANNAKKKVTVNMCRSSKQ